MEKNNLKLITELRHELHKIAELSLFETKTKAHLIEFLKTHTNLEIVDKGAWFYAVYKAENAASPPIGFRADFDALPIYESPDLLPWSSKNPEVSHKCGHDGHSAAMCGLALELEQRGYPRNAVLLFQHAEEIGAGGIECVPVIAEQNISEFYAFHNYVGFPECSIMVKDGTFNCASKGMSIRMTGTPTHASQPEHGKNPAYAAAKLLCTLPELTDPKRFTDLVLCTVIQVDIGQLAFGTAAHDGYVRLTIRGAKESEMDMLQRDIEQLTAKLCGENGLTCDFEYCDEFPETASDKSGVNKVRQAAKRLDMQLFEVEKVFRGSEDFGHLTKMCGGCAFGIGAGTSCPPIHTNDYDFNDNLLETAVDIYYEIGLIK